MPLGDVVDVGLGVGQQRRAGVGRDLVAGAAEHLVERQARGLGRHVPERDVDQRDGLRHQRRVERAQPVPQRLALQRRGAHHLGQQVAQRLADRAVEAVRAAHRGAGDALRARRWSVRRRTVLAMYCSPIPAPRRSARSRARRRTPPPGRSRGRRISLSLDSDGCPAGGEALRRASRDGSGTRACARPAAASKICRGGPSSITRPRSNTTTRSRDPAREVHLVGDDHHRHALVGERLHDAQHLADGLGIERGGRLVEQHQRRAASPAPGRSRPAAAGRPRAAAGCLRAWSASPTLASSTVARDSASARAQLEDGARADRDVAECGQVREQLEVLEHHPHAAPHRRAPAGCRSRPAGRRTARGRPRAARAPLTQRSSVDLPEPEGPIRHTTSPRCDVAARRRRGAVTRRKP